MEKFEAGDAPSSRADRVRNFDAVTELFAARVEKSQGRMSAKRMLPIARAAGYEGSGLQPSRSPNIHPATMASHYGFAPDFCPRNFRRLVAQAKAVWRSENHRGRSPGV